MTPLAADQIGVLRRPGALVAFWAFRFFVAWIVAGPIVDAIAGTGIGRHPTGDAALFEPGGLLLFEAARLALPALGPAAGSTALLILVSAVVALFALASLMIALAHGGRLRFSAWGPTCVAHFPAFLVLWGMACVLQGIVLLLALLVFTALHGALGQRVAEPTADLSATAAALLVLLLLCVVAALQDLARAAVVRHEVGAGPAIRIAWRAARSSPWPAAFGWCWPALISLAIVVAAALLVDRIAVEKLGSIRVSGAWMVHQAAAFALVALRAAWLARALRLVSAVAPELSRSRPGFADRPAGNAAPGDPSSDPGA